MLSLHFYIISSIFRSLFLSNSVGYTKTNTQSSNASTVKISKKKKIHTHTSKTKCAHTNAQICFSIYTFAEKLVPAGGTLDDIIRTRILKKYIAIFHPLYYCASIQFTYGCGWGYGTLLSRLFHARKRYTGLWMYAHNQINK